MVDVLKIGGNELDDPAFLAGLAVKIKAMADKPVIVHGGGKAIKTLQTKFGIEPRYIDGLRVTDDETMALVAMALCGASNVSIVQALTNAGVDAQGFNGADRGLLRAQQMQPLGGDLGRVGQITEVRAEVIREALAAGVVPVIAPVAFADDGGLYNINADQAAGVVAAALGAGSVIFLTNVSGVLHEGRALEHLTQAEAQALIANGVARDGMAVKLKAALDALSAGVGAATITNLDGLSGGTRTVMTL
jgi:acetylglutamate kinase